ncbi:MAG: hypothetical protein ABIP94_06385 [Planctomycetota bacterium]
MVSAPKYRIAWEIAYIVGRARERSARLVRLGQLALFSTATGDAWLLDPAEGMALPLALAGERLPSRVVETGQRFAIEWTHNYRVRGNAILVEERESGASKAFEGYPTAELASL